jgi:protein phosphatase
MNQIKLPELSLVVLIGPSGSGKSTFAARHFLPTEVISSDFCRGLITDNENDQEITAEAFDLLHTIAAKRLAAGRLTVIDATNVQPEARKPLVALARAYHCVPAAIVFNLPERLCQDRNRSRTDRQIPSGALHRQVGQMRRSLRHLKKEGFRYIYKFSDQAQVEAAQIDRQPTWTNRKDKHGPFDIIGDVHGCCDELEALLEKLGYSYTEGTSAGPYRRVYSHPQGRKAIFLGDLVDRGPRILDSVQLVRNMVLAGSALAIPGNHDSKLVRKLQGRDVKVSHGLAATLAEFEALPDGKGAQLKRDLGEFLYGLISHYVLDDGKLVVAHGGMKESMQGRASRQVRDFALYGETTGETDEFGLPVRYNWAAEYRGKARVVYGHTPVVHAEWLNNTINIDTGCVFGGKLTALRYPELELVSVPAEKVYSEPAKPLEAVQPAAISAQQRQDALLDIQDVLGKYIVETSLIGRVTIPEGNSAAALEIMSRFTINPKWLIYLPPTMSPPKSTRRSGYLEYPSEAFEYYRKAGVPQVVCEQKHMGSRLVAVVCKNEDVARRRFGIRDEGSGVFYTRTGRRFFSEPALESALLSQLQSSLENAGFWQEFHTDWVCLDCELMPWSVKAQELLQSQYAAVGSAAQASLGAALVALETTGKRGQPVEALLEKYQERAEMMGRYVQAYRQYCWPVQSLDDLRLAPFHILATEGVLHTHQNHSWHMDMIARVVQSAPGNALMATPYRVVELADKDSVAQCKAWWESLTEAGGEGMVVKPLDFIARRKNRLLQPAVKCRGREYLRIIYGPEYTTPEHLEELRQRNLRLKRSLALREFALGQEALERFVNRQPLRRIHECVFGVLALESEPVDPRL